jgi:hypothetical protein
LCIPMIRMMGSPVSGLFAMAFGESLIRIYFLHSV